MAGKKHLIISTVIIILLANVALGYAGMGGNTSSPSATATIEITDFSFYPSEVVIARGGTVTWKQRDYVAHTVTSAEFNSGELSQGQTFSHTFNEVGTYEYRCMQHPSMSGKVIVESSTSAPTLTPTPQTPVETTKKSSASVNLHGEKTDVVLGENVLLKLSAINIIGNPIMHVQVIIIPPNGWSVTSSEFSKSGAGQYTTMYDLKPEDGSRDIEVKIQPNQIGDNFEVKGRIIYYFGDDLSTREDHTLNLPITVRKESIDATQNSITNPVQRSIPGFGLILGINGLLFAVFLKKKWQRSK